MLPRQSIFILSCIGTMHFPQKVYLYCNGIIQRIFYTVLLELFTSLAKYVFLVLFWDAIYFPKMFIYVALEPNILPL